MSLRRIHKDDSGAAMVEMALVLPLLLLVLFGVIEFGRAINYWIDETHLANEGARFAAVNRNPGPQATLQESIQRQSISTELRDGREADAPSGSTKSVVCIDILGKDLTTAAAGDPVQVTVSTKFKFLPLLDLAETTITGKSVMRLEVKPDGTAFTEECTT